MQDEIIRLLFEFAQTFLYPAQNPSEAEHMAVVATGGYGRGILAPGRYRFFLFLLPYKTDRVERIDCRSDPLCAVGTLGLKVGHATRTVADCIVSPRRT